MIDQKYWRHTTHIVNVSKGEKGMDREEKQLNNIRRKIRKPLPVGFVL